MNEPRGKKTKITPLSSFNIILFLPYILQTHILHIPTEDPVGVLHVGVVFLDLPILGRFMWLRQHRGVRPLVPRGTEHGTLLNQQQNASSWEIIRGEWLFHPSMMSTSNWKWCPGTSSSRNRNSNKTGFVTFTVVQTQWQSVCFLLHFWLSQKYLKEYTCPFSSKHGGKKLLNSHENLEFLALLVECQCACVYLCWGVGPRVYMCLCGVSLWVPVGDSLWRWKVSLCGCGYGKDLDRGVWGVLFFMRDLWMSVCLCVSVPICVSITLCLSNILLQVF